MSSLQHSLLNLSTATSPIQEYIAKKTLLRQENLSITSLLEYDDWHCVSQCCSVLSHLCVGNESKISSWLMNVQQNLSLTCSRHCSCQIFKLISLFSMNNNLLILYDTLLPCCPRNRHCFVIPCLTMLNSSITSSTSHEQLTQIIDRLQHLRQFLPQDKENFIGQIIPTDSSYCSPQVGFYALTCLKVIALEGTNMEWKRKQFFNLNDMIFNENKTDSASDLIKLVVRLVQVFEDDDGKLILATKCIMEIVWDISDCPLAAHQLFEEFLRVIRYDQSVLMDWMTSEETSVEMLSLLLMYVKGESSGMSDSVRHVLRELRTGVQRLAERKVFPYNVWPLLRRMRSL